MRRLFRLLPFASPHPNHTTLRHLTGGIFGRRGRQGERAFLPSFSWAFMAPCASHSASHAAESTSDAPASTDGPAGHAVYQSEAFGLWDGRRRTASNILAVRNRTGYDSDSSRNPPMEIGYDHDQRRGDNHFQPRKFMPVRYFHNLPLPTVLMSLEECLGQGSWASKWSCGLGA